MVSDFNNYISYKLDPKFHGLVSFYWVT
jgi:hypothetical protein